MGSSRSGLVGSTIASYGSRTGFYTDELNEQDFKAPEEIHKANLRGADLRGANIDGLDFHLVDLRDALYDASQAEQLRVTGAILEHRVVSGCRGLFRGVATGEEICYLLLTICYLRLGRQVPSVRLAGSTEKVPTFGARAEGHVSVTGDFFPITNNG